MGEYSLCEDYDYYGSRRDGAFAQYIAVKEGNLLKVDDKVSYEDAATTDPCANALHSMMIGEFKPGRFCLCLRCRSNWSFCSSVCKDQRCFKDYRC